MEVGEPLSRTHSEQHEQGKGREKRDIICILRSATTMNVTTGDFLVSTPTNFHSNIPSRHASYTGSTGRRHESAEGCRASDQQVPISEQAKLAELETVKRVLDALEEGGMDVVGFLRALCWGNLLAVTDPTVRAARTILTHSD